MIPPPPPPRTIPPPPPPAPPAPVEAAAPGHHDTAGVPDHVKRAMAARGDHDADSNAWRTLRFERCPLKTTSGRTCGQHTAIGLDDVGLTRRVDPTPLTEHGELQAVASQQQTFTLTARDLDPTRLCLSFPRGYTEITSRPAPTDLDVQMEREGGSRDYDVVAAHQCGLDRDHYQHTASVHDRRHHQIDDGQPPF